MASSSVANILTHKTGPKTSSLQISMKVLTTVMIVGSMKNPFVNAGIANRHRSDKSKVMKS